MFGLFKKKSREKLMKLYKEKRDGFNVKNRRESDKLEKERR